MANSSKKLSDYLQTQIARGSFPGAQYVAGEEGRIKLEGAVGFAVTEPERIAATVDTIYDLASLTKPLVTSLLAVILASFGVIDLSAPLGDYLSEFDDRRKRRITLTDLLTHVSGLPNWRPLYLETSHPADVPAYISSLVEDATDAKKAQVVYSDLNYILLGRVLERVSGERLDRLAQKHIFEPLGLERTMFNPPLALKREIAATESGQTFERANATCDAEARGRGDAASGGGADVASDSTSAIFFIPESVRLGATAPRHHSWRQGMIWGEVHDGNAHYLEGV
ncbi:MAG TPA: serine hydrolase domain-containing protein, partial [Blastocatellia bacterium]|nr:serine hydrolase domain-containing protein [Blastocatellia bacterium]